MKALITGATSGIGKAMAIFLSNNGWELIITGRNTKVLNELKRTLKTNVYTIQADLSIRRDVFKVYNFCKGHSIDLLINNAGFGVYGCFDKTSLNNEIDMINVNIIAVHILTKLFLRDFLKKNNGIILNVASSAGFLTGPMLSSYYASKSYVVRFSLAIAEELRHYNTNVKMCVFCPGPVKTEFNSRAGVDYSIKPVSPEKVAEYAINKALAGKCLIIPSVSTKMGVFATKILPERFLSSINYLIQSKKQKKRF